MYNISQIEVKESQNISSLLLIKLALIIFDLDLFAMVLGHVYADVTLASRDRWEDRHAIELWERDQRFVSRDYSG